jgi:hypothetical protein
VTDANSCTATATFNITQPPAIVVTPLSQTNISCNGGSNGAASVNATGGTGALSYDWTPGNPTGDGTNSITGLTFGSYTVTVTDLNGCTATQTFIITQPTPIVPVMTQTNVTCFGDNNGTASVSVNGGTPGYTYDWTPGNPAGDGTNSVTGLAPAVYTVTIVDANACTATATVEITEPPVLTATHISSDVLCFGGNDGSAEVTPAGGTPGYSFLWSPGGYTTDSVSGLSEGIYIVTVTDSKGCMLSETVTINAPSQLTASTTQTDVLCFGGNTGSATVTAAGGTAGYTYDWQPSGGTGATATGLSAGTYTVTVTDLHGCQATASVTISQPAAALAATFTTVDATCNGGNNGSATVTVTGGTATYTYDWQPSGGTGATESGLTAGTYSVNITDANGCTLTETVSIAEPTAIVMTLTATDPSCNGGNDGSITSTVSGGTPGYTYSWSTTETTSSISNLAAGCYTLTVTDANGCTETQSVCLTQPAALEVTANATATTICIGDSVTLTGSGADNYTWSGGVTDGVAFAPTATETFVVTGTSLAGCTATDSIIITVNPTYTMTASAAICQGDSIMLGGSYQTSAGVYTDVFTTTTGCDSTVTTTLSINMLPNVSVLFDTSLCSNGGTPYTLVEGTPAGGTWSGSFVSGGVFDPVAAGNGSFILTYTFTDTTGCSASASDTMLVDVCMGVATTEPGTTGWSIYPNPTGGLFSIFTSKPEAGDLTVEVFGADGRLVSSEKLEVSSTAVTVSADLTEQPVGVYFIRIVNNKNVVTAKVIRQ